MNVKSRREKHTGELNKENMTRRKIIVNKWNEKIANRKCDI